MTECPFETDVLDAIASRRWPARAGETLHAHVAACQSCADLATVAGALLYEEEAAHAEARIPAAAAVWHRAQLRAREEATRAAVRPIGFVQGLAFSCGLAAVIGAAAWSLPILYALVPDLAGTAAAWRAPSIALPHLDVDVMALLSNTTLQAVAAAWAVCLPIAVYFTLRDSNP